MNRILAADLKRLDALAFRRRDACGKLVERFHRLNGDIQRRGDAELIWNVYRWLVVPLTLWPIDFAGAAAHIATAVSRRRKLDDDLMLLLRTIGAPPAPEARAVMESFEHDIADGRYEKLVKCHEKFDELEKRLNEDANFRSAWGQIAARFDVAKYRNRKGVIRRMMSKERNFRDSLTFKWRTDDERFRALFDALCHRWNLYGMEFNRPLLLKITVNPTPHGTMIFIPRNWSLDLHRDFNSREIARLHRAHGATRQGPKLSRSRMERQREAIAALEYWTEAKAKGLGGERRFEYVLRCLGKLEGTDISHVKRLIRLAKGLKPENSAQS